MTQRKPADIMAMVVAELVKGPATIGALCVAIGASPTRSDRVQVYIRPLRAAGLIRVRAWLTRQTPVFEWQAAPHALPDEPMPAPRPPKRKTDRRLTEGERSHLIAARKQSRAKVPLGPNSVFALGAL